MNGSLKFFVPGPGEANVGPTSGCSPESEQRNSEGTEVGKAGPGGRSVPFDFKGAACKLYSKQYASDM